MIVGLAGYAGAGKDTAARCLVERGFRQDAFAAPLKAMAYDINPYIPVEQKVPVPELRIGYRVEVVLMRLTEIVDERGWEEAKKNHLLREFLQRLGTEGVRKHLGEDAWVRAMGERWLANDPEHPLVITDVRFPNEAWWIANPWGDGMPHPHTLIWVDRPDVEPVNGHSSDAGLVRDLCTHEVVNDGTPELLWQRVLEVVNG